MTDPEELFPVYLKDAFLISREDVAHFIGEKRANALTDKQMEKLSDDASDYLYDAITETEIMTCLEMAIKDMEEVE